MKEFFCELQPSDWINFIGIILGALIGTLLAGLISIWSSKISWNRQFLLNNEELRSQLIINKRSFEKIHSYSKGISNDGLKRDDEEMIIRDLVFHVQIIADTFVLKTLPADLIKDFKFVKDIGVQIRSIASMKGLSLDGNEIFDPLELRKLSDEYKRQYDKIFKKLDIE